MYGFEVPASHRWIQGEIRSCRKCGRRNGHKVGHRLDIKCVTKTGRKMDHGLSTRWVTDWTQDGRGLSTRWVTDWMQDGSRTVHKVGHRLDEVGRGLDMHSVGHRLDKVGSQTNKVGHKLDVRWVTDLAQCGSLTRDKIGRRLDTKRATNGQKAGRHGLSFQDVSCR